MTNIKKEKPRLFAIIAVSSHVCLLCKHDHVQKPPLCFCIGFFWTVTLRLSCCYFRQHLKARQRQKRKCVCDIHASTTCCRSLLCVFTAYFTVTRCLFTHKRHRVNSWKGGDQKQPCRLRKRTRTTRLLKSMWLCLVSLEVAATRWETHTDVCWCNDCTLRPGKLLWSLALQ